MNLKQLTLCCSYFLLLQSDRASSLIQSRAHLDEVTLLKNGQTRSWHFHTQSSQLDNSSAISISSLPFPKIVHMCGTFDFPFIGEWMRINPGFRVDKLTDDRIFDLTRERTPGAYTMYQAGAVRIVELTDIARLLALDIDGGIYVDSDVVDKIPIRLWLSHFGMRKDVHMILGTEFPRPELGNPIQFTNFALGSVPNNPVIELVVARIMNNLASLPADTGNEVVRTGPVALTAAVLDAMREGGAALPPMEELNAGSGHVVNIREPDGSEFRVALLPYRAFAFNPMHGDDVEKLPLTDHLVEHQNLGRWRQT